MDCSLSGSSASTMSWGLLKFMSIDLVMLSNHLVFCHPLFLLPSIFPSIRVFSNEFALHIRWPKYWSFNNSPSNECLRLVSFRIDWFDLLAVYLLCSKQVLQAPGYCHKQDQARKPSTKGSNPSTGMIDPAQNVNGGGNDFRGCQGLWRK